MNLTSLITTSLSIGAIFLAGCSSATDSSTDSSSQLATSVLSVTYSPAQAVAVSTVVTMTVSGGTAPYYFTKVSGLGTLSGDVYTPTSTAELAVITITDSAGNTQTANITVGSSSTLTSTSTYGTALYTLPLTSLQYYQPSCTDTTSLVCQSAFHRACQQMGFVSGFGANEYDGTNVVFTCLTSSGAAEGQVLQSDLQVYVPSCNFNTYAATQSLDCHSAVSRYCQGHGYASGAGINELSNGGYANIGCENTSAAVTVATTFSSLTSNEGVTCSAASPISGGCMAASKRYCVNAGYTSGYGPVEASGDNATIVCLH